jgi:hypothetical protein
MKLMISCAIVSLFLLSSPTLDWSQASTQPIETTLCALYEHPDQYAGKMVRVRGTIAGYDMWIDALTEKPCSSWMSVVVTFPDQVKQAAPDFDLVKDDSFAKLQSAMYHSRPIHIEAIFEGRFDSVVTMQDGKRTTTGRGYGKKHQYDGRIVLHKVSDVVVRPLGRK